jgi:hypothetical protein
LNTYAHPVNLGIIARHKQGFTTAAKALSDALLGATSTAVVLMTEGAASASYCKTLQNIAKRASV